MLVGNQIAGIVTHCRVGCPNIATRMDRPQFVSARQQQCPGGGLLAPENEAAGDVEDGELLEEVLLGFGSHSGGSTFSADADVDGSGRIDFEDLLSLLSAFDGR
jgi:hypothetical protein